MFQISKAKYLFRWSSYRCRVIWASTDKHGNIAYLMLSLMEADPNVGRYSSSARSQSMLSFLKSHSFRRQLQSVPWHTQGHARAWHLTITLNYLTIYPKLEPKVLCFVYICARREVRAGEGRLRTVSSIPTLYRVAILCSCGCLERRCLSLAQPASELRVQYVAKVDGRMLRVEWRSDASSYY